MRARRFRLRVLMPWLSLALCVVAIGLIIGYLLGRGRASALDLVAWDRGTMTGGLVRLEAAPNDPLGPATPRVALVLGMLNRGPVALQAERLALSLPSWLRLELDDGTPLEGEMDGGNPLVRYALEFEPVRLEPGDPPELVPGHGRVWVRPFASPWHCTLDDDGLPAFLPAPPLDPQRLANATLFWSLEEARSDRRATGTLTLSLDAGLFRVEPVDRPPAYPPLVLPPDSPRPDLAALPVAGERRVACGGMSEPLTVTSTVYATPGGGRILSVAADEAPARLLLDLDGDDTIEAEAWSEASAGRIDRVRRTRFPLPAFLLPLPPAPDSAAADPPGAVADSATADTPPAPPPAPVRPDTTRPDTTARVTARPDTTLPPDTTGAVW